MESYQKVHYCLVKDSKLDLLTKDEQQEATKRRTGTLIRMATEGLRDENGQARIEDVALVKEDGTKSLHVVHPSLLTPINEMDRRTMYFKLTPIRSEILSKLKDVDIRTMSLPIDVQRIKDARKLSDEEKGIVGYNDYVIILENDYYVGANDNAQGLEFVINNFALESIQEALLL